MTLRLVSDMQLGLDLACKRILDYDFSCARPLGKVTCGAPGWDEFNEFNQGEDKV